MYKFQLLPRIPITKFQLTKHISLVLSRSNILFPMIFWGKSTSSFKIISKIFLHCDSKYFNILYSLELDYILKITKYAHHSINTLHINPRSFSYRTLPPQDHITLHQSSQLQKDFRMELFRSHGLCPWQNIPPHRCQINLQRTENRQIL